VLLVLYHLFFQVEEKRLKRRLNKSLGALSNQEHSWCGEKENIGVLVIWNHEDDRSRVGCVIA
jgi:hypothetical protein